MRTISTTRSALHSSFLISLKACLGVLLAFFLAVPLPGSAYTLDTSASPSPINGLWWNPNESGWGANFIQQYDVIFVTIYTYDAAGNPVWYVASNCAVSGNGCQGALYAVTGGSNLTTPWNGTNKSVAQVGSLTLAFTDVNNGTMSFSINGTNSSKTITRQVWRTTSQPSTTDGLWWNPNESGWGANFIQQNDVVFATIYTYDASGNPVWYVASNCAVSGTGCQGPLYAVTGGTSLTSPWNGTNKMVTQVGTLTLAFADVNNGTMSFSITGTNGSKSITRQIWRTSPPNVSATQAEVRAIVSDVQGVVSGAGGTGIQLLLSDAFSALSNPSSTCPQVTTNPPLASLQSIPATLTLNISYANGCTSSNGSSMAGSATVTFTNLALTQATTNGPVRVTSGFSIVLNNVSRNGEVLGNGSVSGNADLTVSLSSSPTQFSGTLNLQMSNFVFSTGVSANGSIGITIVSNTQQNAVVNLTTSNGPIKLNLSSVEPSSGVMTVNTTSAGTMRDFTVQITNLQMNSATCSNYPVGGSISFTKNAQTSTVTFNGSCDGTYAYSGP